MIFNTNKIRWSAVALTLIMAGLLALAVIAGCSGGDEPDVVEQPTEEPTATQEPP